MAELSNLYEKLLPSPNKSGKSLIISLPKNIVKSMFSNSYAV